MGQGRKAKPKEIKDLQGTARKDRVNKKAPVVSGEIPDPPEYLTDAGREIFLRLRDILEELKIVSASHVDMLGILANRLDQVAELTEFISKNGLTYTTTTRDGSEMHRPYPQVVQLNDAMRHAQSLLAEFGLSAASNNKVSIREKKESNPFSGLGELKVVK